MICFEALGLFIEISCRYFDLGQILPCIILKTILNDKQSTRDYPVPRRKYCTNNGIADTTK
jgi:hypothetical protein